MANKDIKNNELNDNKADGQDSGGDQIIVSKQEYEALKSKAEERDSLYDKYVRAHAEFENAKKRLEKEKIDFLRYANESLVFEFLPILDNLEIAEKHIKDAKDFKAVQEGVDMIQAQIQSFLKDIGLERMKTTGEKFDPHIHEAIEIEEANDRDDNLIVAELKPGYRFNGKLLRPASVKIIKRERKEKKGNGG